MSVTLKVVLGTVNYNDYLRVSVAKVSNPGTEVFVEYINVPVSNYTLVIPNLDPDNYYLTFRDAPDTLSLGTLVSQAFVNAMTGEFEYERRFYEVGALPGGVSITGKVLNDPYLVGKNVTGVFKEGFRYLVKDTEYDFDDAAGDIELLPVAFDFSTGEVFAVEIKYNVGYSGSTTAAGIFTATISVTAATYTISGSDAGKRFSLDCAGAKQEVTLPPLSSIAAGQIVYLEHKRSGVQAQTRVKTSGSDRIYFNGLNTGSPELSEVWVAKGESLYLRKEGSYWEIIFDYSGARVGERMAGTFIGQPNYVPEMGQLLDGDEYPALYWWIRNVLPNTHYVTDNAVTSGGYVHPAGKEGLFVIHSTDKKFRLPNTQGLAERGLLDFDSYGADTGRVYDYPGGVQNGQVGQFTETIQVPKGHSYTGAPNVLRFSNGGASPQNIPWAYTFNNGKENRVKNLGVIYLRRI